MKQLFLACTVLTLIITSCRETCEPGTSVPDKTFVLNVLKNGRSLCKTTGGPGTANLPDSVKIFALGSSAALPIILNSDSLIILSDYTRSPTVGPTSQNFRLVVGNLRPDTINLTINANPQTDNCGRTYLNYEIGTVKVNNIVNTATPTTIVK